MAGLAFYNGNLAAQAIKNGNGHQLVDVDRSRLPLKSDENNPVTLLGHLSEYFVLYESATQNVVFIRTKDDSPLFLRPNPNRNK